MEGARPAEGNEGERKPLSDHSGRAGAAGTLGVIYPLCQSGPAVSPDSLFFPENDRVSQKNSRVSRINMRFYAGAG